MPKFVWADIAHTGLLTYSAINGRPVYKRGCVTGATTGRINEVTLNSCVEGWPSDVANQTYVIESSESGPMAAEGDSGAWLVDEEGKLLGIVHGGDRGRGVCYVIPIHDVFEDIKHMTGFAVDLEI